MNCPNCNEPLEPARETRTTTGVSRHYRCPCGLAFNAYRPAYGSEWTVSLVTTVARPKRKPADANRARRAMLKMALEDIQLLGRFGVETEQARQKVINAKESN
ncbi:MAG: hypothetical protein K8I30_02340, partial [Anaerolineae bacterium]|nr:hypothetical protein [Anaerolineae bacterium]